MSPTSWDPAVWKAINDAVIAEISKARVAQQVFPTTLLDGNPQYVANEVIDFASLSMPESPAKILVTLSLEFSLTQSQVDKEPELNTCKTLSRMAAKALALAEDTVFGVKESLIGNFISHADQHEARSLGFGTRFWSVRQDFVLNRTKSRSVDL